MPPLASGSPFSFRRGSWSAVFGGALVSLALVAAACGSDPAHPSRFGPVLASIDEIVGTELTATRVVSLPCIPSRRDPVGVWLGMRIIDATLAGDSFALAVEETDARLGSHPSGCRNPMTLLPQSVFLFDGADPVFASAQSVNGEMTTLEFVLDGRSVDDLDLIVLPTFAFEMGDGMRQTTIFGLIGRYSLAG